MLKGIGTILGLCTLGCSANHFERQADGQVEDILAVAGQAVLGGREEAVLRPEPKALEPEPEQETEDTDVNAEAEPLSSEDFVEPEAWEIGLHEALEIALQSNRDYQSRRESLYLSALSLTGTRHVYTPQLSATLAYIFTDGNDRNSTEGASAGMSLSQILPTGGTFSFNADTAAADAGGAGSTYDSSASIALTQPLLRGFGRSIAWEGLIQAERDLVYAVRDFELFRYDFTIDVARRFYGLVQQKQSIENVAQNLEGFVFNSAQAAALFEVGRTSELDVLRARRSELTSRNDLIEAEESYSLALDQFKIFLGLPTTVIMDVLPEAPVFTPVDYDEDSAVAVAMKNRLDLMTEYEQLEDVERGVYIARDQLRGDLDLDLSYDRHTDVENTFGSQDFNRDGLSAGLRFRLPVNKVAERNAYRSVQISLARARRSLTQFEDNLVIEIRNRFRELSRRDQSLDIQAQLIIDQEKNVRIAELRYEQGDFSNRDVVEARQSLLDARNSHINESVNYEISRLELLRDLGILFVDENGMWKE